MLIWKIPESCCCLQGGKGEWDEGKGRIGRCEVGKKGSVGERVRWREEREDGR